MNIHTFLENTDFTNVENYSKNKRHVLGIVKGLEKENKEYIEVFLPKLNNALAQLRNAQLQIVEQKETKKSLFERLTTSFKHRFYGSVTMDSLVKKVNNLAKDKGIDFRVQTASTKRFQEVAKKLQTLASGATVPGAKILSQDYQLETIGINLLINGKAYTGRIYMGHFSSNAPTDWIKKWSEEKDEHGVAYQKKYSFEGYMNKIAIPNMTEKERGYFMQDCQDIVEYYTAQELATTKATIQDGKIVVPAVLSDWLSKFTPKSQPKESYRQFLETNPASMQDAAFKPANSEKIMYVLTTDGTLHLQEKQRGKANHTSLSGGQAVLAAGHMTVVDGKILSIDTSSGHYKPSIRQVITLLETLAKRGVNIDEMVISYATSESKELLPDMEQIPKSKASAWLEQQTQTLLERLKELDPEMHAKALKDKPSYKTLERVIEELSR